MNNDHNERGTSAHLAAESSSGDYPWSNDVPPQEVTTPIVAAAPGRNPEVDFKLFCTGIAFALTMLTQPTRRTISFSIADTTEFASKFRADVFPGRTSEDFTLKISDHGVIDHG